MRVFDPTSVVIPSFLRRAKIRLAELARLLAALSLTEPWDSREVRTVLAEAQRFRHALRTLARPGSLSLDERRFICERLLPFDVAVVSQATPAPTPEPAAVRVVIYLAGTWLPGAQQPVEIQALSDNTTPPGARLVITRGTTVVADFADSRGGTYRLRHIDETPERTYTASLYSMTGRLLGRATATLTSDGVVRFGTFGVGHSPTDAELRQLPTIPAVSGTMPFVVPTGRQRLYVLLPPGASYALIDPSLNVDISAQFAVVDSSLGVLLRQIMPVIGPFSVNVTLQLH